MQRKITQIFIYSACLLLLATAMAKLVSSKGSARILAELDPIFAIPFREEFLFVALIELAVALACAFIRRPWLQAGLLAWLGTSFLVYRCGLWWVGYQKPCSCLGNLTDALHISPQTANTAMKIILAYLLIGSYATLLSLWLRKEASPGCPVI